MRQIYKKPVGLIYKILPDRSTFAGECYKVGVAVAVEYTQPRSEHNKSTSHPYVHLSLFSSGLC